MFNRISHAEHDVALSALKEKHTAEMKSLVEAAGLEVKEGDDMLATLKGALSAIGDLKQELADTDSDLKAANTQLESFKAEAQTAKDDLKAATETIESIEALFGEKAKEEGFDLVEAVGSIKPESFSTTDPDGQALKQAKADGTYTELDMLSDQLKAGEITKAEFKQKAKGLQPNKLTIA
jgi:chromosome segregation ATPase